MDDHTLTNDDLRLIHALQLQPRASWAAIARAIGSDPVTLARRWARLQERDLAWIAVYPDTGQTAALLEIECAPAETLAIADAIAADPEVLTIDLTTGSRDILVTLLAPDREQLASYVLTRMSALPLISALRTQVTSSIAMDARRWRLRALDPFEVAALEKSAPAQSRSRTRIEPDMFDRLLRILTTEPRITTAALADKLGVGQARAGALLSSVLNEGNEGQIVLRTEIARAQSEWPEYVWYFLKVSTDDRAETIAKLASLREARLVASLIGSYDLALAVWLRSLGDVPRLDTYLAKRIPEVAVVDRSLVLRTPLHLRRRIAS